MVYSNWGVYILFGVFFIYLSDTENNSIWKNLAQCNNPLAAGVFFHSHMDIHMSAWYVFVSRCLIMAWPSYKWRPSEKWEHLGKWLSHTNIRFRESSFVDSCSENMQQCFILSRLKELFVSSAELSFGFSWLVELGSGGMEKSDSKNLRKINHI